MTLPQRQLERDNMYVPIFSNFSKLVRRKGGGRGGGGRSSGSRSGGGRSTKVSSIKGLPGGYSKATPGGKGGGRPVLVEKGSLAGWEVGGGTRAEVYGPGLVFTTCISQGWF